MKHFQARPMRRAHEASRLRVIAKFVRDEERRQPFREPCEVLGDINQRNRQVATGRFNLAQGFVGTLSAIGASLSTTFFSLVSGSFGGAIGFISIACVALSLVLIVWFWMPETMPSNTKPHARL